MNKPRLSLLAASVSLVSFLLVSGNVFAHKNAHKDYKDHKNYKENYKDEVPCPAPLTLKGGFYIGMQGGYDMYRVAQDADITIIDPAVVIPTPPGLDITIPGYANAFSVDPRVFPSGAVNGGFIGYGMYFDQLYNLYLGVEAFGNFSLSKTDYEVVLDNIARTGHPDQFNEFKTRIRVKSNYGIDVIPGIKLNPATLFYVRLGYDWANVDVTETIVANLGSSSFLFPRTNTKLKEQGIPGGFHYGTGIEVAVMDNFSVRGEYNHTTFGSFDANNHNANRLILSEITASDNQFLLGIVYHPNWF